MFIVKYFRNKTIQLSISFRFYYLLFLQSAVHGTGSQSLLTSADLEYKIVPTGIEWYEIDESILPGNNSLVYISIILM